MAKIQETVLSFVRKHDANPANDRAEQIPAENISAELASAYGREVLASLGRWDVSAFHKANEILFEYIPPAKRKEFLGALERKCAKWSKSAVCFADKWKSVPKEPPTTTCVLLQNPGDFKRCGNDKKTFETHSQIKTIEKIPIINRDNYPDLYRKIKWFIDASRKIGELEFATSLESALENGKLRYLPDLKMAQAFTDPRYPNTIIFSKTFFERTWGDEVRGIDGKPVMVTDEEVLQRAEFKFGKDGMREVKIKSIAHLELFGQADPGFKPSTIRDEIREELKKTNEERFKYYFGSTSINAFPADMPTWIITLGHEFRHTMQLAEDQNDWAPEWAKGLDIKHRAYYSALILFNTSMKYNEPYQSLSTGRGHALLNEAGAKQSIEEVTAVREREATAFGLRIAKKVKSLWIKTTEKP